MRQSATAQATLIFQDLPQAQDSLQDKSPLQPHGFFMEELTPLGACVLTTATKPRRSRASPSSGHGIIKRKVAWSWSTLKANPGSFPLIVLKGTSWVWSRCHSVIVGMGSGFVDFGVLLRVFGKGLVF